MLLSIHSVGNLSLGGLALMSWLYVSSLFNPPEVLVARQDVTPNGCYAKYAYSPVAPDEYRWLRCSIACLNALRLHIPFSTFIPIDSVVVFLRMVGWRSNCCDRNLQQERSRPRMSYKSRPQKHMNERSTTTNTYVTFCIGFRWTRPLQRDQHVRETSRGAQSNTCSALVCSSTK